MFYQGVKTCVFIQKCAAQMKKQTRLRKVILNVVNTASICWNDSLKSWVLNLLGRSIKLVNSSEKYLIITQTYIVF